MNITFLDDSIPFDGNTPNLRPLGGTQKAVVGLAGALAARGLRVTVINRGTARMEVDGVHWRPWDDERPAETDMLVAVNRPGLLDGIEKAGRRILWVHGSAKYLSRSLNQEILDRWEPRLVFVGKAQFDSWKPWRKFKLSIVEPGVAECFRHQEHSTFADRRPRALITTHPLHGLEKLVTLWRERIHSQAPDATLHVFSAALAKGIAGEPVDPTITPILDLVRAAREDGVVVEKPGPDSAMLDYYRDARVHLYPAIEGEAYASTLAESQSAGLPAVALSSPATAERIRNGQTGYLVPDHDAMVNLTVQLLTYPAVGENLSRDARLLQSGRSWEVAGAEFTQLLG